MQPAQILNEGINLLDPQKPLKDDELAAYYVERNETQLRRLQIELLAAKSARDKFIKLLFTGHRGSGKSTELNKLSLELRHHFLIVPVPMREFLPSLNDMTYVDVLLAMATGLFKQASERQLISQAAAPVLSDLWDDLKRFLENTLLGGLSFQPPPAADELSVKVNLLAVEFQTKFKTEGVTREQVIKKMEYRLAEVLQKINLLSDEIKSKYGRPVLFIVEDTDKADLAPAKAIFFDHGRTLADMRAFAIYTFPIELRYTREFGSAKANFDNHPLLPNFKPFDRSGAWNEQGLAQLQTIITRRLDAGLIHPDALQLLARCSGGLTRILIRLARMAALNAVARGAALIEIEDVEYAVGIERSDFIALLRSDDYPKLAERHRDKNLNADSATQELLQSLALLEYTNDTPWCDVHPIVLPVVEERAP